jgi:hypothetical protein
MHFLTTNRKRRRDPAPPQAVQMASGRAGVPPADPGVPPGSPNVGRTSSRKMRAELCDLPGGTPGRAGGTPALPGTERAARVVFFALMNSDRRTCN